MDWLMYFERNRVNRLREAIPWELGFNVEPHLRVPLIQSLQRFQVGEQGNGLHLKRGAAATGDAAYAATINLFVAEEQEHARLLARVVRGLDGELLKGHWSDACFILLRHLSGLHLELMVLLVAEMIAKRYYRALSEGTNDPVLKTVFDQILRDEFGHVAFHSDFLRSAFAPLPHPVHCLISLLWTMLFRIVCLVVMYDHRAVLRATGVSPHAFWHDCGLIFNEVASSIFNSKLTPRAIPPSS
jgi:hypothetical protein